MCLIARHLESCGIPTLCLTSALDIVQAGQPPRAVFVNYPLGHTAGLPFDRDNQAAILSAAVDAFDTMQQPGEIVTLPHQWPTAGWEATAMQADSGDTRAARDESPQWQFDDDRIRAAIEPASG